MAKKHIAELLIEVNKKVSDITDKLLADDHAGSDKQDCIDDLNNIIRQLDHVVEELEKVE